MTATNYLQNPEDNSNYDGWILIQMRQQTQQDRSFEYYQDLYHYEKSFEEWPREKSKEEKLREEKLSMAYWAGLDAIHEITKTGNWELLMIFYFDKTIGGGVARIEYDNFKVGSQVEDYRCDRLLSL